MESTSKKADNLKNLKDLKDLMAISLQSFLREGRVVGLCWAN